MKLLLPILLILTSNAFAENLFDCSADFSVLEGGVVDVKVVEKENGQVSLLSPLVVNDVEVREFEISDDLVLGQQPGIGDDFKQGEAYIQLLHQQDTKHVREMGDLLKSGLSVDLKKVSKVVAYDLSPEQTSFNDKFGGVVGIKLFSKSGQLLGQYIQMLVAKACK